VGLSLLFCEKIFALLRAKA